MHYPDNIYNRRQTTGYGRVEITFLKREVGILPSLPPGSRILDWGCNRMDTTREIKSMYPESEVIGIDLSNIIGLSRDEILTKIGGLFIVCDGYELCFAKEYFDAVFCMNNLTFGLQQLKDVNVFNEIIINISDTIKPNGYLLISSSPDFAIMQKKGSKFILISSDLGSMTRNGIDWLCTNMVIQGHLSRESIFGTNIFNKYGFLENVLTEGQKEELYKVAHKRYSG